MPFHGYSPKAAKSLFKAKSIAPPNLAPQSPSRITKSETTSRKPSPLSQTLKDDLERTRALVNSINKEKYETSVELARMGFKQAAKARLESAQRAALDEELKLQAIEELKARETDGVIERLREELTPKVRTELLETLKVELEPSVRETLKDELYEELQTQVWNELRDELAGEAIESLKQENYEQVIQDLKEEHYAGVIVDLKDEHRDRISLQVREEVEAKVLAELREEPKTVRNGIDAKHENTIDPSLRAESEASDVAHPPAEMAVVAKRRFSDTFKGEDGETRMKKLKMIGSNVDEARKAESLPPMVASNWVFDQQAVDESLEEGEKGDIESGTEHRFYTAFEAEALQEKLEEVDQVKIPEDIYAGGDEMSEKDVEPLKERNGADMDADAQVDHSELLKQHPDINSNFVAERFLPEKNTTQYVQLETQASEDNTLAVIDTTAEPRIQTRSQSRSQNGFGKDRNATDDTIVAIQEGDMPNSINQIFHKGDAGEDADDKVKPVDLASGAHYTDHGATGDADEQYDNADSGEDSAEGEEHHGEDDESVDESSEVDSLEGRLNHQAGVAYLNHEEGDSSLSSEAEDDEEDDELPSDMPIDGEEYQDGHDLEEHDSDDEEEQDDEQEDEDSDEERGAEHYNEEEEDDDDDEEEGDDEEADEHASPINHNSVFSQAGQDEGNPIALDSDSD